MFLKYAEWMADNVKEPIRGSCQSYTKKMQEAFPELRRHRGLYHCPQDDGRYQHWWLSTPDGEVIDPTAAQFHSHGRGQYEELSAEYIENNFPIGKCYNCGEEIYKGDYHVGGVCSEDCYREYTAYINKSVTLTRG